MFSSKAKTIGLSVILAVSVTAPSVAFAANTLQRDTTSLYIRSQSDQINITVPTKLYGTIDADGNMEFANNYALESDSVIPVTLDSITIKSSEGHSAKQSIENEDTDYLFKANIDNKTLDLVDGINTLTEKKPLTSVNPINIQFSGKLSKYYEADNFTLNTISYEFSNVE